MDRTGRRPLGRRPLGRMGQHCACCGKCMDDLAWECVSIDTIEVFCSMVCASKGLYTPEITCINCGQEARWCDSQPMEFEEEDGTVSYEDHECAQIACDSCGAQYDFTTEEVTEAETFEEAKLEIRKIYKGFNI